MYNCVLHWTFSEVSEAVSGVMWQPRFLTMDSSDNAVLYAAEAGPGRDRGQRSRALSVWDSVSSVAGGHGAFLGCL